MARLSALRQQLAALPPLRRFFQGKEALLPPVKLHRRCIYILPSKAGLGFLAMIAVVLIGAMNYQNNLAYLLGFGLISLFLVAKVETYRQLLGLTLSLGHIEPVFCGQALKVPVIIKTDTGPRFALQLEQAGVQRSVDVRPPYATIPLALPTHARGRHRLGLLRLNSRFPLGLFCAWTPLPLAVDYLVYPEAEANAPACPPHTASDAPAGAQRAGDDDFAGIKSYHPGESPRHIHWKAYAKGQGLLSRQFATAQQTQHRIDWAATRGLPLEQRLSRLTAWLLDAERHGEDFALHMPGEVIALGHGAAHLHRCLQCLAVYQQGNDT